MENGGCASRPQLSSRPRSLDLLLLLSRLREFLARAFDRSSTSTDGSAVSEFNLKKRDVTSGTCPGKKKTMKPVSQCRESKFVA